MKRSSSEFCHDLDRSTASRSRTRSGQSARIVRSRLQVSYPDGEGKGEGEGEGEGEEGYRLADFSMDPLGNSVCMSPPSIYNVWLLMTAGGISSPVQQKTITDTYAPELNSRVQLELARTRVVHRTSQTMRCAICTRAIPSRDPGTMRMAKNGKLREGIEKGQISTKDKDTMCPLNARSVVY